MSGRLVPVLQTGAFIVLALVLCSLIFLSVGLSATGTLSAIIDGAFFRPNALNHILRWGLPLLITAVGVIISFRAGYFNIGAQGQFYLGAICAAFAAEWLRGSPALVAVPICLLAGMAGGALWALWPALLRVKAGADEVITTMMGNFIAAQFLVHVTSGPLKDPAGSGQQASSRPIDAAWRISESTGSSPIIIAIAALVVVFGWWLVNRTSFGILSGLAGRNPVMVTWQGAKVQRIAISAFLLSGALAGLAGSVELMGPNGRLASGFLPDHGFTAILIALVAGMSVIAATLVALFFGALTSSGLWLPIMTGLPSAAIDIIHASIALFITAKAGALRGLLSWFRR
ncbi:ABC transporter permease [Pseudohoeflea coraliihabitans]|uniref:ABC transporter permease n=1 Tax=Pseudohoeflea coraliihabitans TaxID=2860393 RepID=A0ABS6WJ37_9HYPH|nr:ABC transporter permease [Pseudohoeflea sp. DP4N28-3]MBW3095963.1 ABC transporter permease [Pseudohoeflea sp. DP4N28-3]